MPRPKGSRNKVDAAMKRDILRVYRRLGGATWLERWARENEGEFVKQALSRLFPAAQRADEEANDPRPIGDTPALEVAKRLAFVLASGVKQQQEAREPSPHRVIQVAAEPATPTPEPESKAEPQYIDPDPFRGPPGEPLPTPKRKEEDLTNYYGSSAEHTGPAPHPPEVRVERRPRRPGRRKLV